MRGLVFTAAGAVAGAIIGVVGMLYLAGDRGASSDDFLPGVLLSTGLLAAVGFIAQFLPSASAPSWLPPPSPEVAAKNRARINRKLRNKSLQAAVVSGFAIVASLLGFPAGRENGVGFYLIVGSLGLCSLVFYLWAKHRIP